MKILAILIGLMIVSVPAFAASELSDSEMGAVYAGQDFTINDVVADGSAVAAQSNIGVIAGGDYLSSDSVQNTNVAYVLNEFGISALALQNNIGAAASCEGSVASTDVANYNYANVDNKKPKNGFFGAAGSSLEAGECVEINEVCTSNSAVAAQSNIGAIVGGLGMSDDTIQNTNVALVINRFGNSAAALQNNIGAAASCGGSVDSTGIANSNSADVQNKNYEDNGWVAGNSLEADGFGINDIRAHSSAVALQSNIAAIYAGGSVTNSTISNVNSATVTNFPKVD